MVFLIKAGGVGANCTGHYKCSSSPDCMPYNTYGCTNEDATSCWGDCGAGYFDCGETCSKVGPGPTPTPLPGSGCTVPPVENMVSCAAATGGWATGIWTRYYYWNNGTGGCTAGAPGGYFCYLSG